MRHQLLLATVSAAIALTGCGATAKPAAAPSAAPSTSAPSTADTSAPASADPVCEELKKVKAEMEQGGEPDVAGLIAAAGESSAKLVEQAKDPDLVKALQLNIEIADAVKKATDGGGDVQEAVSGVQAQIDESEALTDKVCGKF
ncbi:hypothetical protein [Nonomuraea typhae]|uniref:hypothetical protein n=1 Tax=Nonomuraea typhae TaxID=2603600 RepID=UPI0012FBD09D|nr:hypothetical protein [Nonomuraea typhae]